MFNKLCTILLIGVGSTFGQSASLGVFPSGSSLPSFEVATVKPNRSANPMSLVWFGNPNRVTETNVTIKSLIKFAYNLTDQQLSGGPTWLDSERYDLEGKIQEAKADELQKLSGAGRVDQIRLMVQALLTERFNLKVSHQTKNLPVLVLAIAKDGPKLSPAQGRFGASTTNGVLTLYGATITSLKDELSKLLGVRVEDGTDIAGVYDMTLDWTSDKSNLTSEGAAQQPTDGTTADSLEVRIARALQEQVGLTLRSQRYPVPTILVEHIDKPTDN
jgi:bla regulator protein BlaR1